MQSDANKLIWVLLVDDFTRGLPSYIDHCFFKSRRTFLNEQPSLDSLYFDRPRLPQIL